MELDEDSQVAVLTIVERSPLTRTTAVSVDFRDVGLLAGALQDWLKRGLTPLHGKKGLGRNRFGRPVWTSTSGNTTLLEDMDATHIRNAITNLDGWEAALDEEVIDALRFNPDWAPDASLGDAGLGQSVIRVLSKAEGYMLESNTLRAELVRRGEPMTERAHAYPIGCSLRMQVLVGIARQVPVKPSQPKLR